jgi:hypothetical protein
VSINDALQGLWNTILELTSIFVLPDWNEVIGLLPLLIFIGVIGPAISALMLGVLIYQVRKPRVKTVLADEGPRPAALDEWNQPIYPPGLPHCKRDALVYRFGAQRCDVCRQELGVSCPMCGVGRSALIDTCGNCGLVLKIEERAVALLAGRPKPGGAAAA